MFGGKEDGIGPFNAFRGETVFTSTLCQAEKNVGGGYLPSRFLRDGLESVERVFGTCNGVDNCGSGGNDGAWLIVASMSSWATMWGCDRHPRKWEGVHPRNWWCVHPRKI